MLGSMMSSVPRRVRREPQILTTRVQINEAQVDVS